MSQPHVSMEPSPGGRRLVAALQSATPVATAANAEVRQAICEYVRELKTQEAAPERVLVRVKNVIAAADRQEDSDERQRFLQQVITWCIEEYYRGT